MTDIYDRLSNVDTVQEDDVLEFLQRKADEATAAGVPHIPINEYWRSEDLEHYRKAVVWWPKETPGRFICPPLSTLCHGIILTPGLPRTTFYGRLSYLAHMTSEWLRSEGADPANPHETKDERRRRKGREAVQRHRAQATNPGADEAKQLHSAYIAACQARKAAAQAAHDKHTPAVEAAFHAWQKARQAKAT